MKNWLNDLKGLCYHNTALSASPADKKEYNARNLTHKQLLMLAPGLFKAL